MNAAAAVLVPSPPQERSSERRLGASQTAAAIGVHPYQKPIDVWLQLTGRAPSFAGNEATKWGNVLEPVIRAHYVELHKVDVHVPPTSLFHVKHPWWSATPDGIVVDAKGRQLYVAPQVKNVGLRQSQRWEESPPTEYQVQAITEMAVTGLPRLDFAVLVGGQEYRELVMHRDEQLEADVETEAEAFWRLVETDRQPAVDGSDSFRKYLLAKVRREGLVVPATPVDVASIERWREIVQQLGDLEDEQELLKNLILSRIVEAGGERMRSPLGDITVGKPGRKVAWKDIATDLSKHVPSDIFAAAVGEHASESTPAINRPRSWSAKED